MMNVPQTLSEDAAVLQEMVMARDAEIHNKDLLIEKLKHQIFGMKRNRFGSSSESIAQIEMKLEDEEIAAASQNKPDADTVLAPESDNKPKRKPLPDHLPRVDQVLAPGKNCTQCGGRLKPLGESITEELEYIPGRFRVNRIIRPKLCGVQWIISARRCAGSCLHGAYQAQVF